MTVTNRSQGAARVTPPVVGQARTLDFAIKSGLDRILAGLGLILLSPVLGALAVAVKIDSPGPVLYRRRVMGMGGSQFDAFKYRTMVLDGDKILDGYPDLRTRLLQDGKLKDDPRITGSGRWLRKLSLDELPQLVNILCGQMSLVGPRMISPPELARYGEHATELLMVRPGLTGLWQVSGRSDLDVQERVRLDLQYAHSRSLWLDLKLMVLTIPAVLAGRGAY